MRTGPAGTLASCRRASSPHANGPKDGGEIGEERRPVGSPRAVPGEARIICEVGTAQHVDGEAAEQPVVDDTQIERPVARFEQPDWRGAGRSLAESGRERRRRSDGSCRRARRGWLRCRTAATSTCWPRLVWLACKKASQHGVASHHPGRDIDHRRPDTHRRAVGEAVERHQAAFGLNHRVVARSTGRGAGLTVGRDRAVNEARVGLRDGIIVEPRRFMTPGVKFSTSTSARLIKSIATAWPAGDERSSTRLCLPRFNARKAAVNPPIGGLARMAHVVAVGMLYLDDARAEIGEQLGTDRTGQHAREIGHQRAVERRRCAREARLMWGEARGGSRDCRPWPSGPSAANQSPRQCAGRPIVALGNDSRDDRRAIAR